MRHQGICSKVGMYLYSCVEGYTGPSGAVVAEESLYQGCRVFGSGCSCVW